MMSNSYLVVDEVQLVSDAAVPNLLDIDRFELFAKVCVALEHLEQKSHLILLKSTNIFDL